eukprot:scaffold2353_cov167-Amphora_coffeaeformis.AAC.13
MVDLPAIHFFFIFHHIHLSTATTMYPRAASNCGDSGLPFGGICCAIDVDANPRQRVDPSQCGKRIRRG